MLAVLALDLGVFHRRAHVVRVREAASWVAAWATLATLFGFGVLHFRGTESGLEFFAGYLVELSLSVDNIFVFVLIFSSFQVPPRQQHRVLFWGILGALIMRGAMIAAGVYLIERFHWVTFVFGAFLVITGARMALRREMSIAPEKNPVIRLVRRYVPITKRYRGQRFFISRRHVRAVTPLFVVLVLIETTDVIFAVDSIPAVFAVTRDPFIVYTSNVFAILGLRSLYFLLAGIIRRFHYLRLGLSVVLVFVGVKMLLADVYAIPTAISLGIIAGLISISVAASLLFPRDIEATVSVPESYGEPRSKRQDR